jgi:DNA modification methylase
MEELELPSGQRFAVYEGECVEVMSKWGENTVDAFVLDPPYGLEFMGKDWDKLGGDASANCGTGIGARATPWVSYGGDPLGGSNPTCATCGGRKRGARTCECEAPDWRVKGRKIGAADLSRAVRGTQDTWKRPEHETSKAPKFQTKAPAFDLSASASRAMQDWHQRWAAEALRVLKPGGYLAAFGGARTFHRLVCALEDAGFEIRDVLSWHYGQGFPKSYNGAWGGTALKPGWEPIVLARKAPIGTVAKNHDRYGTGGLNIDACRLGDSGGSAQPSGMDRYNESLASQGYRPRAYAQGTPPTPEPKGRWPANVVLTHSPECAQVGTREVRRDLRDAREARTKNHGVLGKQIQGSRSLGSTTENQPVWICAPGCPVAQIDAQSGTTKSKPGAPRGLGMTAPGADDSGGASRFFYTSKASNSERWGLCRDCGEVWNRGDKAAKEKHAEHKTEWHPTVKPVELMEWLVKLVTPEGGMVVDCFAGTGTTGEAATRCGYRAVMIEKSPVYASIIRERMRATFGGESED